MKTLRFIVKGQMIKKDPESPFREMVAGSENYYIAEFDMDSTWVGFACLAKFTANGATEVLPIQKGKVLIPSSALAYKTFQVSVIGRNSKGAILTTNTNQVYQTGGK